MDADKIERVAIIGGGLSGLVAQYHLRRSSKKLDLTVFEKNFDVGGLWLYTDQTKPNDFGLPVHSAVYKYLRSNLPKPLMTIPGFDSDQPFDQFPDREQVHAYLQSFCDKNNLRKYIKLNTLVKEVRQVDPKNRKTQWTIKYCDVRTKDTDKTEVFDYVIVCNGIQSCPRIPNVPGSDKFKGYITHSLYYRHPEIYANQTVAVLGGKFSAMEIGVEISEYATKVYVCNRGNKLTTPFPDNFVQIMAGFDHMTPNSVVLDNGDEIYVDSVVYCTGYLYDFQFLPEGVVNVKDGRLVNLYKDIVPVEYSSIMLLLAPSESAPFALTSQKAFFIRAILDGTLTLPQVEEMDQLVKKDLNHPAVDFLNQWEYDKDIASLGKFDPLPSCLKKIGDIHFEHYMKDFLNCKKFIFKPIDKDSFTMEMEKDKK